MTAKATSWIKTRVSREDKARYIRAAQACGMKLDEFLFAALDQACEKQEREFEAEITTPDWRQQCLGALKAHQSRIPAVRLYRKLTGSGLKEANDAIKILAQEPQK